LFLNFNHFLISQVVLITTPKKGGLKFPKGRFLVKLGIISKMQITFKDKARDAVGVNVEHTKKRSPPENVGG
jgi:hypothetical protein